jgi:hypothetical protein
MNRESEPSRLSKIAVGWRLCIESALRLPMNYDVIDDVGAILQAKEVLSQGKGLVIGFPHFSKRDGLIYGNYALHVAQRQRVPLVLPMALHQYDDFKPALRTLSRLCDGLVCPIVIDDTVKREKYKDLPIGQGMKEYLISASKAIQEGGIVALSLQGGRKASLGEPVPALSTLLEFLFRRGVDNYAVHFVGITPKTSLVPEAFEDLDGWNMGMRYTVRPGNTYMFKNLQEAFGLTQVREYAQLDAWGYRELAGLVQESYRGNYKP